jgi:hypothetical protein
VDVTPTPVSAPSDSTTDTDQVTPVCPANTPALSVIPRVQAATLPPAKPPADLPPAKPPPSRLCWQDQVCPPQPLPKIKSCTTNNEDVMFPPGSILDQDYLTCPPLPSTPFDFPFGVPLTNNIVALHPGLPPGSALVMDSVTHVVGLPRVCGLVGHSTSDSAATLVDTGANICVTGLIKSLVDVFPITAVPISVATNGSEVSQDDCYTLVAFSRSQCRMAPSITRHATSVRILLRRLSPLRLLWLAATFLFHGNKLVIRMALPVVSGSTVIVVLWA